MKLVLGRSGSGKSYYCMNEIKKCLGEAYDGPLLYMVPEQFSLTAEYNIAEILDKDCVLEVQVLSFKRLCHRIYNEFSYKQKPITKAGKAMLVYAIMSDLDRDLVLLKGANKKPGLVKTVCDLISEFKRYNILPETLLSITPQNRQLGTKLQELYIIYSEYEKRIKDKFDDSDDDLKKVLEYAKKSKLLDNAKIWIDGFDGFTPQELELIRVLNNRADVTISISADKENGELFLLNEKAIKKLKRFANIEKIYLEDIKRFKSPELFHLEKNFNVFPSTKYDAPTANVDITVVQNLYDEIENVAINILHKVRDENYRFKDILVASRSIENYRAIFKMIFERYNIPYFVDSKTELSTQPLVSLVLAFLDICSKGFETNLVFNYLKTGLTNIEDCNDIDLLENYVLKYGIKGKKWNERWEYDEPEVNDKINVIREMVVTPIISFKNSLPSKKTAKEISLALYNFLVELNVKDNIQNLLNKIKEKDSILSVEQIYANSYIQVWNIFVKLLDELVYTFGEEYMSFEKFKAILKEGVSVQEIGLIPTNKDQVTISDISRSRNSNVEILYVIGVNDGVFPMQYNDEGFLNDEDRNILLDEEIEVAKDTKMMLLEENFNIYKTLTTPTTELHLSYPISNNDGSTLRPSSIINQLKKIFPNIVEKDLLRNQFNFDQLINTASASFSHLALNIKEENNAKWGSLYKWYKENIPYYLSLIQSALSFNNATNYIFPNTANALYGNTLRSSVSKMETFSLCPFMFYLKYGIKLKERKIFKLETPDIGIFMHDILDKFSKYLDENNMSFRSIEKEEADKIVSKIVDELIINFKYNIFTSNSRMKYLSVKLKRVVKRIVWVIALHIKNSKFDVAKTEMSFGTDEKYPPIRIELDDGKEILLTGKIDRVDIAKTEDGKYIRIIDYKSSNKEIKISNIYYGIQLQLITYLDLVSKDDVIPGGALYLKLDDPIIRTKKDISVQDIEKEITNKLKMNGIILADAKLVAAMDTSFINESSNLNLSLRRDGSYGKMPTATSEELKKLCAHTKHLLKQFGEEILKGNIKNEPIHAKNLSPCSYCDYKEICNFDKEFGNRCRNIKEMKNDEIYEQIKLF